MLSPYLRGRWREHRIHQMDYPIRGLNIRHGQGDGNPNDSFHASSFVPTISTVHQETLKAPL